MNLKRKILSILALSLLSQVAHAIPFTFEGRSLGMGGVSVATADLATAAWANPAMLTNQRREDNFSLLIGAGLYLRDNDDLITDIDDFQDADDRRQAASDTGDLPGEAQAILDMSSIIGRVDGKIISPEVTILAAMGMAFDTFAMAISIRGDAIAAGTVTNLSCSLLTPGCDPNEILSEDFNILNLEGVLATEYGVSFAKDFQLFERKISIGVKPKIVELEAFTYRESILTLDTGVDDLRNQEDNSSIGTFNSVDLGIAMDMSNSIRLGLNIRNLLRDKFSLGNQTLNFETEARFGAAYHNHFVTVAVDYDLFENEPLLANQSFNGLRTQYLALGAEFNAYDYVKLRMGVAKNLAGGISNTADAPLYSVGVGFWLGFNLDIAVIANPNSIGAFLQTGFRF